MSATYLYMFKSKSHWNAFAERCESNAHIVKLIKHDTIFGAVLNDRRIEDVILLDNNAYAASRFSRFKPVFNEEEVDKFLIRFTDRDIVNAHSFKTDAQTFSQHMTEYLEFKEARIKELGDELRRIEEERNESLAEVNERFNARVFEVKQRIAEMA